ncbi:MAG: sulfatase-like hydrolase/transferase [Verrucomicrobiae bacterium]|nr:sulfatase-like hydrolase/transferase [Verrucomicrobiae bacterium]
MRAAALFPMLFAILCNVVGAASPPQPNINFILADDLGYGDLACYGSDKVATPNLDGMAKEGMKLTSFYVAPVCSPTRASFMTGCIPQRVGIGGVLFPRNTHGLNPDEITLPELLKKQGYATAIIGKWHLGNQDIFQPLKHGFDRWYGTIASNSQGYYHNTKTYADNCVWREGYTRESVLKLTEAKCALLRDNVVIEVPADQTQFTQRYTREAIRFITANKDKPFFLYMPHNMVHIPLHVSADFVGKSKLGIYGDAVQELDWSTGEILKTLKKLGLDKQTLVVFTSDNGPHLGQGASAGLLRGAKGSTFEGGVRVPFIARWPGKIPANRVIDEPVTIMDMLPTFVSLAGGSVPQDRVIDGKDIWPVIVGTDGAKSPHDAIYYLRGNSVDGIGAGDWKLLVVDAKQMASDAGDDLTEEEKKLPPRKLNQLVKERAKAAKGKKGEVEMLFNLRDDPGEKKDLSKEHPDVAARLKKQLLEFRAKFQASKRPAGMAE